MNIKPEIVPFIICKACIEIFFVLDSSKFLVDQKTERCTKIADDD